MVEDRCSELRMNINMGRGLPALGWPFGADCGMGCVMRVRACGDPIAYQRLECRDRREKLDEMWERGEVNHS